MESIQALDIFSIPRGGSELGTALALAVETFSKSPASNHGLVIFSDGGEADVELEKAIEQAIASQILVLTIGVGTDTGSLIPDPDPQRPGDWVRDANGNVVKTRLESGPLKEVAHRTRGHYLKLDSRTLDERLIRQVLAVLDRHQTETKTSTKPIERYQWPLSAGLLLLLLAWMLRPSNAPAHTPTRRPASAPALLGISLGVSLGIGLSAPEAQAKWWHDVTHSTRSEASAAATALDSGHSEDALKRYEALLEKDPPSEQRPAIEIGLGTAAYRLEDYDRAVAAFSRALAAQDTTTRLSAHQGLAHSLYDQGDRNLAKMPQFTLKAWRDSLRHFKAALTADPANEALRENRDFVQDRLDRLIEEILKQQQQQRQQGQGQKGQKGQQGQEGEEGEEGQQGQNGQQGKQGQQGQGGEEGDDPNGRKGKNGKDGEDGSGGQTAKGQPGEGQQEREAQQLPEGQITAGTEGAPDPNSDSQNAMKFSDGDRRQETGFSENEARTFLRIYADDQKSARMNQQRHNAARGKDW